MSKYIDIESKEAKDALSSIFGAAFCLKHLEEADAGRYKRVLANTIDTAREVLEEDVPEADVAPVRYGKWERSCVCSVCGTALGPKNDAVRKYYNYCPWCGAMMRNNKKDEKK